MSLSPFSQLTADAHRREKFSPWIVVGIAAAAIVTFLGIAFGPATAESVKAGSSPELARFVPAGVLGFLLLAVCALVAMLPTVMAGTGQRRCLSAIVVLNLLAFAPVVAPFLIGGAVLSAGRDNALAAGMLMLPTLLVGAIWTFTAWTVALVWALVPDRPS